VTERFVQREGWALHLRRTLSREHLRPESRPLMIVPGYGMNSFIFGYHPEGTSLESCLAEAGFEVWALNMRGQSPSRPIAPNARPATLRNYAERDVLTGVETVLERTHTDADRVDLLGASLGGSIVYAHLALLGERHRIGSVVTIGAPLRWVTVHPLLRVAFRSSRLAATLRFSGTQQLARVLFPLLARVPGLLSLYMNAEHVDLSKADQLVRTVDDPQPLVNHNIARWIQKRDMVLRGINVTEALAQVDIPLLVVLANRDGLTTIGMPTRISSWATTRRRWCSTRSPTGCRRGGLSDRRARRCLRRTDERYALLPWGSSCSIGWRRDGPR